MNTPLSRLQHDISLAPGIPDSYRLFGEGPTVSTYGDLREVVGGAEAPQDRLTRHHDIILEAINEYDCWLQDDDFNARACLDRIVEKMKARIALSTVPPSQAASKMVPPSQGMETRELLHGIVAFEDPPRLEYVAWDAPVVHRTITSSFDLLLDVQTREPVGFTFYGRWPAAQPHPDVSGLVEALSELVAAASGKAGMSLQGGRERDALAKAVGALSAFQSRQEKDA